LFSRHFLNQKIRSRLTFLSAVDFIAQKLMC
jgi:hypothetical protein